MDASFLSGKTDLIGVRGVRPATGKEVAVPLDAPLTLGPFTIDPSGRLAQTIPGHFPSLTMVWRGRIFDVLLGEPSGGLRLNALLGRVPSTADSATTPRDDAFAALRLLRQQLPAGWAVTLLPDHRVALSGQAILVFPATAVELVGAMAALLLEIAPYFDLLESVGIVAEPCPGNANT